MSTFIYHHTDGDGYGAAAIIGADYPNATFIPCDFYKPMNLSQIKPGDTVFMLDYTSSRDDDIAAMNELWNTIGKNIRYIHIDHHKSALTVIARCEGLRNYLEIDGGIFPTEEFNQAGCMLAYIARQIGFDMFNMLFRNYYFEDVTPLDIKDIPSYFEKLEKEAPIWLQWTGDHDIYSEKYEESHIFSKGCFYLGFYDVYLNPDKTSFLYLLGHNGINDAGQSDDVTFAEDIYDYGHTIKEIMDRHYGKVMNKSFEIYIHMCVDRNYLDPTNEMKLPCDEDGNVVQEGKILCANGIGNSEVFLDKFEEYDAVILFSFDGETIKHSIYSNKSSNFKCNVLGLWGGKFFGISGGGHDHAAGFYTEKLFFRKEEMYFLHDGGWKILSRENVNKEDFETVFGVKDK